MLLTAIVVAVSASWWAAQSRMLPPPSLDSLGAMDPDVASFLGELRAAVEEHPDDADAWGRLAMGFEANGFVGAARDAYRVSSQLAPHEPRWSYRFALVAARLGDGEAALAALGRTNDLAPQYVPAWSRRGMWLLDRGDTAGAESAFLRALAIDGADLSASLGLARVYLARRDNARAVTALERSLARHPGDRYALQLLGTAYRRMGRIEDAALALSAGAEGEPAWDDPWSAEIGEYRRGFATELKAATAEAMAGRFDRALPLLERLRARHPADVPLANHTAEVLLSAGRADDAIRLLTPIVRSSSANADTHIVLANAYLATGDPAQADAHADRALALHATGARAFEIKGIIAWRGGRTGDAQAYFEQGFARDPREGRLRAYLGLIAYEEGRPRDALTTFSDVIRRDPTQPDALAGLALAHAALGDRERAALALARAEQIAPDHPRVREARARLDRAPRAASR